MSEIINGTIQITPENSVDLSEAFGSSPEFWYNLEANYRDASIQKDESHQ